MKLSEQDFQNISDLVNSKYIHRADHPTLPFSIYNYTPKTQFEGRWTPITRQTRGLVLDEKHNIVIKCIEKFFNQGEELAASINFSNARISSKADGYLIQVKKDSEWGLIITSRGSFDNQYIEAAKTFITDEILSQMKPDYTYFCELCQNFPGDEAIILTKHPIPKLVCWAIKDQDFNEVTPDNTCPFPITQELSLDEAKSYLKQKVEGVVAQDLNTKERIKIKTSYFIQNHRLISDCTEKRVWEILSSGNKVENLDIPDEFMPQMQIWQDELLYNYHLIQSAVQNELKSRFNWSDKQIALDNTLSPEMRTFIFTLKKKGSESLSERIWAKLKPRNVV